MPLYDEVSTKSGYSIYTLLHAPCIVSGLMQVTGFLTLRAPYSDTSYKTLEL